MVLVRTEVLLVVMVFGILNNNNINKKTIDNKYENKIKNIQNKEENVKKNETTKNKKRL